MGQSTVCEGFSVRGLFRSAVGIFIRCEAPSPLQLSDASRQLLESDPTLGSSMVCSSWATAITLFEGFVFFCISFMGRVSRAGILLNPIYMISSLCGIYGSLTLTVPFLLVFCSANMLMNVALLGVALFTLLRHGSPMGFYFY